MNEIYITRTQKHWSKSLNISLDVINRRIIYLPRVAFRFTTESLWYIRCKRINDKNKLATSRPAFPINSSHFLRNIFFNSRYPCFVVQLFPYSLNSNGDSQPWLFFIFRLLAFDQFIWKNTMNENTIFLWKLCIFITLFMNFLLLDCEFSYEYIF